MVKLPQRTLATLIQRTFSADPQTLFGHIDTKTDHHGLSISSAGLPRNLASNVLFHAIQENLLEILEEGKPTPQALILWTKGTAMKNYVHSLISVAGLPIPFLVRNLEELGCPPIRQLTSDIGTSSKAKILAEWLIDNDLDDHALVRNCT